MADIKISQLPAYTAVSSPTTDVLEIVDTTNAQNKKITVQNLLANAGVQVDGTAVSAANFTDTATTAVGLGVKFTNTASVVNASILAHDVAVVADTEVAAKIGSITAAVPWPLPTLSTGYREVTLTYSTVSGRVNIELVPATGTNFTAADATLLNGASITFLDAFNNVLATLGSGVFVLQSGILDTELAGGTAFAFTAGTSANIVNNYGSFGAIVSAETGTNWELIYSSLSTTRVVSTRGTAFTFQPQAQAAVTALADTEIATKIGSETTPGVLWPPASVSSNLTEVVISYSVEFNNWQFSLTGATNWTQAQLDAINNLGITFTDKNKNVILTLPAINTWSGVGTVTLGNQTSVVATAGTAAAFDTNKAIWSLTGSLGATAGQWQNLSASNWNGNGNVYSTAPSGFNFIAGAEDEIDQLARTAVSLTTTGAGAASYSNLTGVFNIPTPPNYLLPVDSLTFASRDNVTLISDYINYPNLISGAIISGSAPVQSSQWSFSAVGGLPGLPTDTAVPVMGSTTDNSHLVVGEYFRAGSSTVATLSAIRIDRSDVSYWQPNTSYTLNWRVLRYSFLSGFGLLSSNNATGQLIVTRDDWYADYRAASAQIIPDRPSPDVVVQYDTLISSNGTLGLTNTAGVFTNSLAGGVAGRWHVTYQLSWAAFTGSSARSAYIAVTGQGGTSRIGMSDESASSSDNIVQTGTGYVNLAASQSFSVFCWQNSGASTTINDAFAGQTAGYSSKIQIVRVR